MYEVLETLPDKAGLDLPIRKFEDAGEKQSCCDCRESDTRKTDRERGGGGKGGRCAMSAEGCLEKLKAYLESELVREREREGGILCVVHWLQGFVC